MKKNYIKPESIIINTDSITLMDSSCICNNCQCDHNHNSGNGGNSSQAHCNCENRSSSAKETFIESDDLDWSK